jgi:Tol biopolymer transport system component
MRRFLSRIPMLIIISATFAILLSTSFVLQTNQAAWAGTFPGPNGQIVFVRESLGESEIYIMNPDGSGQTGLTDNNVFDTRPS